MASASAAGGAGGATLDVCPGLFINGAFVAPADGGSFADIDPSTEGTICMTPAATAPDIDKAVAAARAAFKTWGVTTGAERAVHLRALAAGVRARRDDLAALETRDNGKPLPEAEWDIDDVAGCLDYYAGMAEELDAKQDKAVKLPDDDFAARLRYEPIGVVAAVTPWNYPMLMSIWKVAPALAAGCCVVLKPSELAPITSLELGRIAMNAGLPAGVLNIVTGTGPDAGEPLISHPGVDKVSFTGSVGTGSRIMGRCATAIRNVTLELGGKSPAIVFADADIERAVEWVMFGAFWTNGQICSATSRLLLDSSIADRFLARLKEETDKIVIAPPFDKSSKMGPLVSEGQYKKVLGFIERAKAAGLTALCGGGRPEGCGDRGYYVAPTVFVNVKRDSEVWRSEIFGPVLSVMTFDSEADAIERANDNEFGLAAAVFTKDADKMARVTRALRCGIVWNNCSQPCFSQLPWGGMKKSGIGRDLGEFGLHSYLEPKQVTSYVADKQFGWYFEAKL
uniref:Aldehyde dehydrogenase domain-containing protein n=1 Tax=Bicosoecida sp. CB-2014 TaxID=1486930 RepID=A0A7S1GF13_9STRA|mmetsp:Transcript_7024/g.24987  ORF Transcript_7024/g.24987 Transcript_7024/m.24987 type:complete len:510 (+) Transcript_7024:75-1604(+)